MFTLTMRQVRVAINYNLMIANNLNHSPILKLKDGARG